MSDTDSARPNPLHVAIAKLEEEMTDVLGLTGVSVQTRRNLETRLRELKVKAGMSTAPPKAD